LYCCESFILFVHLLLYVTSNTKLIELLYVFYIFFTTHIYIYIYIYIYSEYARGRLYLTHCVYIKYNSMYTSGSDGTAFCACVERERERAWDINNILRPAYLRRVRRKRCPRYVYIFWRARKKCRVTYQVVDPHRSFRKHRFPRPYGYDDDEDITRGTPAVRAGSEKEKERENFSWSLWVLLSCLAC